MYGTLASDGKSGPNTRTVATRLNESNLQRIAVGLAESSHVHPSLRDHRAPLEFLNECQRRVALEQLSHRSTIYYIHRLIALGNCSDHLRRES